MIRVRPAAEEDVPSIKKIANVRQNKKWLGFVSPVWMGGSISKEEMHVALSGTKVIGFIRWHLRRDGWTTVYEICVDEQYRKLGVGRKLLGIFRNRPLRLKCHCDNPASVFYRRTGFRTNGTFTSKGGKLMDVWERK